MKMNLNAMLTSSNTVAVNLYIVRITLFLYSAHQFHQCSSLPVIESNFSFNYYDEALTRGPH